MGCCKSEEYTPLMQTDEDEERKELTSSILTEKELNELVSMLSSHDSIFHKKTWKLILNKTGNELNRDLFIKQVYNKPTQSSQKQNIIIIIKTVRNNVCGGYTCVNWTDPPFEFGLKPDTKSYEDDKALVFTMRSRTSKPAVFKPSKKNSSKCKDALQWSNLVYCRFGFGALQICDYLDVSSCWESLERQSYQYRTWMEGNTTNNICRDYHETCVQARNDRVYSCDGGGPLGRSNMERIKNIEVYQLID
eukprot:401361_1